LPLGLVKPYLQDLWSNWSGIVDAADWLRHDLGVSKSLWGEACVTMGRDLAAVALAIVSTKEPGHFRSTPGGYFRGMVARAKAHELHLDRTIWAWRRASQPDRNQRGRGVDRDQGAGRLR
jgi:replication initiation protein RepC